MNWTEFLKNIQKLFIKFINDITSLYKNGKILNNKVYHDKYRTKFKKYGEYEDSIDNIVYNQILSKKIIKAKSNFWKKQKCSEIFKKNKKKLKPIVVKI